MLLGEPRVTQTQLCKQPAELVVVTGGACVANARVSITACDVLLFLCKRGVSETLLCPWVVSTRRGQK